MNNHSYFTDRIVLDAGERLFQLEEKLQELKNAEYPSDGPLQLIRLLDLISGRLSARLITLNRSIAVEYNGEEKESLVYGIKRLAYFVSWIYRWLGIIELAQSKYNPQELVLPLEEIARQIYRKSGLLISSLHEENYTYVEIIDQLRERLGKVLGAEGESLFVEYPDYFAVLSFPSAARDNVLQHAVFGHELGHLANDVYRISEDVRTAIDLDEIIAQEIDRFIPGKLEEEEFIKRKERLNREVFWPIGEWLKEIVADVYAVNLWGPASFFANAHYLLTRQSLDTWTDIHPSPRFRLHVMLDEIKEIGYFKLIEESGLETVRQELDHWRNLAGEDEQELPLYSEILTISPDSYLLAKKVLKETGQRARQEIHERVKGLESVREPNPQDMQDIIALVKLLHEEIPPCEIRNGREKPYVGIAAILNAGWVHRITHPRDISRWKRPADIRKFFIDRNREEDSLVLRAVDLSEICRLFSMRRERE